VLAGSDQDLIVVENDEAVGIMTRALIINSLKEGLADTPVSSVMLREFGRLDINDKLTNAYTYSQQTQKRLFPGARKQQAPRRDRHGQHPRVRHDPVGAALLGRWRVREFKGLSVRGHRQKELSAVIKFGT
jgi:CBS domain-containing protein